MNELGNKVVTPRGTGFVVGWADIIGQVYDDFPPMRLGEVIVKLDGTEPGEAFGFPPEKVWTVS